MKRLTWEEVLQNPDLQGGVIECVDSNSQLKVTGPIQNIIQAEGILFFNRAWTAEIVPNVGLVACPRRVCVVYMAISQPMEIGTGCIQIYILDHPMPTYIFLNTVSRLNPENVIGLDVAAIKAQSVLGRQATIAERHLAVAQNR